MSSQQIAYPDTAVLMPPSLDPTQSPQEPTSAGTTDSTATSNADYFDGHLSASQAAEVPVVSERAAPQMGGANPGMAHGPSASSSDKYGDMGKMVMGLVGTVAASQMSHGGGHGGYGHKKKYGKGALLASGAKMAYDMYNKKAGGKPGMPGQQQQQQQPGMYPTAPGQPYQQPYGAPVHGQQQPYGAPSQQQFMPQQPGMPPYGH